MSAIAVPSPHPSNSPELSAELLREYWPISSALRAQLLDRFSKILTDPATSTRDLHAFSRLLLGFSKLNVRIMELRLEAGRGQAGLPFNNHKDDNILEYNAATEFAPSRAERTPVVVPSPRPTPAASPGARPSQPAPVPSQRRRPLTGPALLEQLLAGTPAPHTQAVASVTAARPTSS